MKVILIHGNGGGTGQDNWFPYVKQKLQAMGIECQAPNFPDPIKARATFWLPYLDSLGTNEETILVGHSSGAVAALRYAEAHTILGSVLVGGYHTDLGMEDEKESGYFNLPWNWEAIRKNQQWIGIFASTDDPWIPIAEAHFIRDSLRADYFEYSDRGHFGYDAQVTEFPELVDYIQSKTK